MSWHTRAMLVSAAAFVLTEITKRLYKYASGREKFPRRLGPVVPVVYATLLMPAVLGVFDLWDRVMLGIVAGWNASWSYEFIFKTVLKR